MPSSLSLRAAVFQSTPSARRATQQYFAFTSAFSNFNPRPPRGGRHKAKSVDAGRPSISIHALREEGDGSTSAASISALDFNPRPPRGGRLGLRYEGDNAKVFQSTPSARRATRSKVLRMGRRVISIHALREEGDAFSIIWECLRRYFNPRPPRGGRRRWQRAHQKNCHHFNPRPPRGGRRLLVVSSHDTKKISIHALREEGDPCNGGQNLPRSRISIHALREEGDLRRHAAAARPSDFNPRPPRGGRLLTQIFANI